MSLLPRFCAICTTNVTLEDSRTMDGYTICRACDEGEVATATPEARQLGYQSDGGIGGAFQRQLSAAHDATVPAEVVRLDRAAVVVKRQPKDVAPLWDDRSPEQIKYARRKRSNNRGRRKDSA